MGTCLLAGQEPTRAPISNRPWARWAATLGAPEARPPGFERLLRPGPPPDAVAARAS